MLCYVLSQAQGPQQLVTVPIGPGSTAQAWLYLPADYSSTNKKYPVVLYYHGAGESGNNPNRLLNNGIPRLIAEGMRPDSIVNPVDGEKYSFIVLSVQHWSWSPNPDWLPFELNWLRQNYRIDTNRVYVTGISAGGQQSFNTVVYNHQVSSLVAAAAPMSPPALGSYDITMISTYKIKTWFFSGATDPFTQNAQNYSAQCNNQYAGSSKLSIYPGGHCCWRTYYRTNWQDSLTGLSVWQWFLTNSRLQTGLAPLPVKLKDLKVADLGNKTIGVSFSYENENGDESFFIRIWLKGALRELMIKPEDRTGPRTYSKIINLNQ
jgi:hypothetical protein